MSIINSSHPDEEILVAYIESTLRTGNSEMVRKHVATCDDCFLRLAVLKKNMNKENVTPPEKTPPELIRQAKDLVPVEEIRDTRKAITDKSSSSIKSILQHKIRNLFAPVPRWGYAVVFGLVVLCVILVFRTPAVKNISMGDQLVVSSAGPLGFVDGHETRPFTGMRVALSDDQKNIIFTWPDVPAALYYDIILSYGESTRRLTPLPGINTTSFIVSRNDIEMAQYYIWAIQGKLQNGDYFEAKAKFLIHE
ncbi:hypothetical protein JW960_16390 [candidate division KSB1 bacterium]|nr:hypothetical protein [candidate division KSB1 bacterium]